jgi:hypothetical protein
LYHIIAHSWVRFQFDLTPGCAARVMHYP